MVFSFNEDFSGPQRRKKRKRKKNKKKKKKILKSQLKF